MTDIDAGFLRVGDNDKLVGIITDRDIAIRTVGTGETLDAKIRDVRGAALPAGAEVLCPRRGGGRKVGAMPGPRSFQVSTQVVTCAAAHEARAVECHDATSRTPWLVPEPRGSWRCSSRRPAACRTGQGYTSGAKSIAGH